MRNWVALAMLLLLAFCPYAEFSYVGKVYIKDTGKWINLSSPSDVQPSGDYLYVLDTGNSRVVEFYKGEPNKIISGAALGKMLYPKAFWFADNNKVYVASTGTNDVVVYDNWLYSNGFSVSDSDAYSFNIPSGVAVLGNLMYVSDTGRGIIKLFDLKDRTYAGKIGSRGFGEGQLSEPAGIEIKNGLIYVADRGNNRVQIFNLNGSQVSSIRGSYECVLNSPRGVAVSDEGFIFVSDSENDRIVVFDKDYRCVDRMNGSPWTSFSQPVGIRVESSGKLYVADSGHAVIQIFQYIPYYQTQGEASKKIEVAEARHSSLSSRISAATHLGFSFEDLGGSLLEKARSEFAGGRFSNAYFNATQSVSETEKLNASLASSIHTEVLRITLGDEQALDLADQEASRYNLNVDSSSLRAEIIRIQAMLDAGKYYDAAFNSTALHPRVLEFKASVSGSSGESSTTKSELLLAISDAQNELSEVSASASGYILDINFTEITSALDAARESCNSYDFGQCREKLSAAKGKINVAKLLLQGHAARVESARGKLSAARQELSKTYGMSYFFKPDMSPAEKRLSEAEAMLDRDPDGAVEKVKSALDSIDGARAGIDRTNQLTIIGIGVLVLLLVAVVVVYYATRGKPRKRKGN